MKKLIIFLYRKRISRLVESYESKKDYFVGENYLRIIKNKVNVKLAIKQSLSLPSIHEFFSLLVDTLASLVGFLVFIFTLLISIPYSALKLIILPFRIYLVNSVQGEILKQILDEEAKIENDKLIDAFLKKCNKDFSNVEFTGTLKKDENNTGKTLTMAKLLFWYNEEVIREYGVDNFKIKDNQGEVK